MSELLGYARVSTAEQTAALQQDALRALLSPAKLKQARKMIGEKTPVTEVAQVLGVSRATLYRRVPELAEARRSVSPSSATGAEPTFLEQA